MTQSVPSRTAFATSEHSARVGLGAEMIDSNICVAVMTGFPMTLHWLKNMKLNNSKYIIQPFESSFFVQEILFLMESLIIKFKLSY